MIYRFGQHSLNTDSLELEASGSPVLVEPRVFQLLQYLIENRARVVSKDDIVESVWNGRIVSDAALTYAVKEARRVVGDDGKNQSIIRTLPRRGLRFVADVTESTSPGREPQSVLSPAPPADIPSIAVLAFVNMSGDPEQDYFSDGMAEDLITDISKISGLFVVARNSSFAFKGQSADVKEIASKLGVRHILEGSVRKMGSKLRVNAQLIDAASGGHIWAERYDGDMSDIFGFQDDIRERIVSTLQVKLTPADKALVEKKPTENVEAYDLFLRARASYYRYTLDHLLETKDCLEKAVALDPNFADAYGYLSYYHFFGWSQLWPGFENNLEYAHELAEKGAALNPGSAIALARLGWIQWFLRRNDEAIGNLERANLLEPNNADVIATFGQVLNYWGDPERGLAMQEKAFSIDTIVPPNWEYQRGLSCWLMKQYERAIACNKRAVERAPNFTPGHIILTCCYVETGRLDDAKNAVATILNIIPAFTLKDVARIYAFRLDEHRERLFGCLRKAGLTD